MLRQLDKAQIRCYHVEKSYKSATTGVSRNFDATMWNFPKKYEHNPLNELKFYQRYINYKNLQIND